eukprot:TRINITY_DN36_c0_g1_i2.p1 TRINITY_DN36_c0_g1~~TRINITY_DN36_c0_g1_i2.p1  ORF type:complete len:731 (+),score=97.47 TRINITY_DN36_c0_g1_i2:99-2291(+)
MFTSQVIILLFLFLAFHTKGQDNSSEILQLEFPKDPGAKARQAISYNKEVVSWYKNITGDLYHNQTGFIRVYNGKFVDEECNEYLFFGWNGWELIEAAIGYPQVLPEDLSFLSSKKDLITYLLDKSIGIGMNVIRIFGHGTTSRLSTQLYCCPGSYKEEVLHGLDYILDEAARRDMKIILTFGDNWRHDFPDTVNYYVNFSTTAKAHDDFWSDAQTKQMYKNHITYMVNRKNSFNGRTYKEDPTIFAWNIINEGRCTDAAGNCYNDNIFASWVDEMARHIKEVDPNHMITIGYEGFFGPGCYSAYNPGIWAQHNGQNSPVDHSSEYIDFIGTHVWPDTWNRVDLDFTINWVNAKITEAIELSKPLVLEEFGKVTVTNDPQEVRKVRNPVYEVVLNQVESNLVNGGPLKGALFWTWNYGQSHEKFNGYGIEEGDDTWDLIREHTTRLRELRDNTDKVEGCTPGRGPTSYSDIESDKARFERSDPYTCCKPECGSMWGWLEGQIVQVGGEFERAEECCEACRNSNICEGWNWCTCKSGCEGYNYGTCLLKDVADSRLVRNYTSDKILNALLVRNYTSGAYAKWISGVPDTNFITHTRCNFIGQCAFNPMNCGASNLEEFIACPGEDCNAEQVNYAGEVVVMNYNDAFEGTPATSAAQCCEACKLVPDCNVWVFFNQKDPFDEFPGFLCSLKKHIGEGKPTIYERGEFIPWISGFLPDKLVSQNSTQQETGGK